MGRYVALKISVSEVPPEGRELQVLRALSRNAPPGAGCQHVVRLLDDFCHTGPNGTHVCLVLEPLGPSVSAVAEGHCADGRLPGIVAKRACKEALLALDFLHKHRVGHGGK